MYTNVCKRGQWKLSWLEALLFQRTVWTTVLLLHVQSSVLLFKYPSQKHACTKKGHSLQITLIPEETTQRFITSGTPIRDLNQAKWECLASRHVWCSLSSLSSLSLSLSPTLPLSLSLTLPPSLSPTLFTHCGLYPQLHLLPHTCNRARHTTKEGDEAIKLNHIPHTYLGCGIPNTCKAVAGHY